MNIGHERDGGNVPPTGGPSEPYIGRAASTMDSLIEWNHFQYTFRASVVLEGCTTCVQQCRSAW